MSFYGRARARQICVTYVFTQNIPEKDDSKNEDMQVTTTKNTQNNHEHHEKSQTHQDEPWQDSE
jgi:hypothetical protein